MADQAEDRCHRTGQKDSVGAWYLLAEGTIDDEIHALIEKKRAVVDAATEGTVQDANVLSDLKRLLEGKAAQGSDQISSQAAPSIANPAIPRTAP
jgi:SWI/SNF-related matrix-associated actin-dependent regulator 1 of chromatin subfamily A